MRLFAGILLPESLESFLAPLCCGLKGARWVDPDNLHVTLRFIGEVDPEAFHNIKASLRRVRSKSFSLQLKGTGVFPETKQAQVLWAGLSENPDLIHLQKKVEALLTRECGLTPDSKRYTPHVTLARVKRVHPEHLMPFLQSHGQVVSEAAPVRAFQLFSSLLSEEGSQYTCEESYPLVP